MKKVILGICIGIAISIPTSIFASSTLTKIDAYLRPDFNVSLNGNKVELEQSPVIVDGSMYLPLKAIAAVNGLNVQWNDNTLTAELSSVSSVGTTGSNKNSEKDSDRVSNENTIVETQFENMRAISIDGEIFFSAISYNDLFLFTVDESKNSISFDYENSLIVIQNGDTEAKLPINDSNVFIHNGETFIHQSYFGR